MLVLGVLRGRLGVLRLWQWLLLLLLLLLLLWRGQWGSRHCASGKTVGHRVVVVSILLQSSWSAGGRVLQKDKAAPTLPVLESAGGVQACCSTSHVAGKVQTPAGRTDHVRWVSAATISQSLSVVISKQELAFVKKKALHNLSMMITFRACCMHST
jgi:hypothetical protein